MLEIIADFAEEEDFAIEVDFSTEIALVTEVDFSKSMIKKKTGTKKGRSIASFFVKSKPSPLNLLYQAPAFIRSDRLHQRRSATDQALLYR